MTLLSSEQVYKYHTPIKDCYSGYLIMKQRMQYDTMSSFIYAYENKMFMLNEQNNILFFFIKIIQGNI